jgi:hypothetical protein
MAQRFLSENTNLAAMVSTLAAINVGNVTVGELGLLTDGSTLMGPLYEGHKIVLDLTPGEDDWLEVIDANTTALQHYNGEETQALQFAVRLGDDDSKILEALEKKMQRCLGYSFMSSGKAWKGMHHGQGKVILNIILGNSTALTPLRFVHGGTLKKGFGQSFLDECLNGGNLANYNCRVKVELECFHKPPDDISVNLRVHTVIFAPVPKCNLVDLTTEEEVVAIMSAKRFKYRF